MRDFDCLESRDCPTASIIAGNLVVDGTAGNDNILVDHLGATTSVKIGGVEQGPFNTADITDHVIVNAFAGIDTVQVRGSLPSEIHGGDGADILTGGLASDIIFGGAGNDFIQGGSGDDVLFGGAGVDRLSEDAGNGIVVGGTTSLDYYATLAVLQAWSATQTVDAAFLASITDADGNDRLTGGSGADWFIGNASDIYTDFNALVDTKSIV